MKWRIWLRNWLTIERIIPTATILVAFVAQILEMFGVVQFSIGENLILILIGLLAVDALTERLTVLEKIRTEIREVKNHPARLTDIFQTRSVIPSLEERFRGVQSIDVIGMSLLALATSHDELLLKKAQNGCRIRLLLLNPDNDNLMKMSYVFVGNITPEGHRQEILTSLNTLTNIPGFLESGLVEIRLYDYPLAHGLLITNTETSQGEMRVETYLRKKRPTRTPGFFVKKAEDPDLFDVFCTEFNEIWDSATPYAKEKSVA